VTHSYDVGTYGKGRRTGMIDPSGTSTFQYDARGLLKQEDKVIGSRTYVSGYEHDKNGNLKQVRYPTEDATWRQGQVDYSYDGADRVSLVTAQIEGVTTPVASGFAYKSFGPRKEMTFGNLLVDTRSYGTRYQLDTWTLPPILSYTHTFNNDLNLVARTDNLPSGNNRSFDYDEIHRLTLASAPSLWGAGTACPGSRTYTYDKNGNRQCKGETSTVTTYTYVPGTNRLDEETIGIDATAYSHDLNGNITGVGTRTFHYNDADRLSTVDMGTTASYTYDGDGRRARKTVGTTTTQFFYDPFGRLLTELNTAAGIGTDYLYLLETPIARVDWSIGEQSIGGNDLLVSKNPPNVRLEWSNPSQPSSTYAVRRKRAVDPNDWSFVGNAVIAAVAGTTYDDPVLDDGNDYEYRVFGRTSTDVLFFYHTDHLGTPIAMTNTSGTPEWRAEYLPFGGVHSFPVSGMASNLRFAGQYFDQETELHENGHRFYRPTTGRYDEPDPLGILSDELHPYLYALGNPLHLIDPLGLTSFVGFPPDKERDMRNAVEVVRQKLESEPCCVGGGASQLQQKLDKATFLYRRDLKSKSDPLCGAVGFIDWFKRRAKIGEIAFDSSRCGALQCTVLHEVVHLRIRNAGEASAYAAEKKCFACGTGVPPK
jgi:RHS repeat-associated protein